MTEGNIDRAESGGAGPDRRGAIFDIFFYLVAGSLLYLIEEWTRSAGLFPFPEAFSGLFALVVSFFFGLYLIRRRGQRVRDVGLRRPRRWWQVPVFGLVVMVVTIVAQLTVVPLLAKLLNLPPPDMSKYESIVGNLPMLLLAVPGTMITGGFMEEVIYRGFMFDRLMRILGPRRRSPLWAALLCGLPFGVIHFEWGIGGILVTTVMGSVLGLMFLMTKRNLWPLIAAHATLDAILMIQVYTGVLS
jgi:membrane protease YdiL (CAAX protease family)